MYRSCLESQLCMHLKCAYSFYGYINIFLFSAEKKKRIVFYGHNNFQSKHRISCGGGDGGINVYIRAGGGHTSFLIPFAHLHRIIGISISFVPFEYANQFGFRVLLSFFFSLFLQLTHSFAAVSIALFLSFTRCLFRILPLFILCRSFCVPLFHSCC